MSASCPACPSGNTAQDGERGEVCCTNCGLVLADGLDDSADYLGTAHAPVPTVGRSTVIGVGQDSDRTTARLRKHDEWIASSRVASSLRNGHLGRLRAMHDKLGLPESVFERAAGIYKRTTTVRDCRGRHLMSIMTASLYLACREADAPRTLRDLNGVSGLPVKAISKHVRFILERENMTVRQYSLPRLITRAANTIGISPVCRRDAIDVAAGLDGSYLAGKNPLVLAAALLYVVAARRAEKCSAEKAANTFNVSEAGVRHRASELREIIRGGGG